MRIVVCMPGNNFSSKFLMSLWDLQEGCHKRRIELIPSTASSSNVYMVRSKCLGADLKRGTKQKPFNGATYDYLLWIDSDQVFSFKHLEKLLSYNKDIVSAYYAWEGGQGLTCGKWDIDFFKRNMYMPYYTEMSLKGSKREDGLVEVDWVGFGFLLVKHGVFETLEYPWFKPHYTTVQLGSMTISDFSMEDVGWCLSVKEKGFKIYVDPTLKVGHEKTQVF